MVLQFFKISKIQFVLAILPLAIIIEYIQYKQNIGDSLSGGIILRDTISILFLLVGFFVLSYFKKSLSPGIGVILFVTLLLLLFLVDWYFDKPVGHQHFYKHIIDVLAYLLGPFVIYPFIAKFFL